MRGDWSVRRPRLEPGGWAFEFANDNYPDIDDTAEVVLALRAAAAPGPRRRRGGDRARHRAGCWACSRATAAGRAFDADNTRSAVQRAPVLRLRRGDRSAERRRHGPRRRDARARGVGAQRRRVRRGCDWLLAAQEPRRLLVRALGREPRLRHGRGACRRSSRPACPHPTRRVRRAVRWLEIHQNADGGWGEDLRSYVDASWRGRGNSTASQTAWALLALLAAGERSPAVERGVAWLVAHAARRRRLGRARVHRHRLPRRLLHQLPPLPARVPDDGARAPSCGSLRRSPADGCSGPPDAHGRELSRASEARGSHEVPADRRARAAVRVQPRLRGLRQDPAPARGPEAAHERRGGRARRSRSAARRWCRSPAASR